MFTGFFNKITSFIVIVCSLLGLPFGGKTQPKEMISYDSGKTTAIISLESNPSTGYKWEFEISDKSVLEVAGDRFIESSKTGVAGAPGTREVSFKGLKAGEATVTFRYLRSWEEAPAQIVAIKITVAANKTLSAEETLPAGAVTSIDQVVAAYNAACAATKDAPKGEQTLKLNGAIKANGALGVVLRVISPAAEKALAKNTLTTDYIPGNPPLTVDDVVEAAMFTVNGATVISIKLKNQTDGWNANSSNGPVGRGIGTLGNLQGALKELGADMVEGSESIALTYTNAAIKCTVDAATGAITGGDWHYAVNLHVDEARVKLGISVALKNLDANINYQVII